MRFIFYHITCFLVLTFLCRGNVHGQIDSVNADKIIVMSIKHADTTLHVFYTDTAGSLKARDVSSGTASFAWFKDSVGAVFSKVPFSQQQQIQNLRSGGYKLRVTGVGIDTSFYVAWVFVDSLKVSFEKDGQGNIRDKRYTCDYTDLKAESWSQSRFIYYDAKNQKQTLPTPAFKWEGDSQHLLDIKDTASTVRLDTTQLPYEKATFYVHLRDKFGATSKKDFAYYIPIVTKAKLDTTGMGSYPYKDSLRSAPFVVFLKNLSKNGNKYTWLLPDKLPRVRKDTTKMSDTLYITGTYKIKLVSQSLQGCVDTTHIDIQVAKGRIEKGTVDLPTAFTPDGDHKTFRIYNTSIMHFKIAIYSRWGKIVYRYEGPNMLDWEGWNGKIHNTGNDASEGIYFYVLEVMSWDKTPDPKLMTPSGKYNGFFYLFRKKK
jgi:hypothetical protein